MPKKASALIHGDAQKALGAGSPISAAPFNPLAIPNVALTLAVELLEQPVTRLPPSKSFSGAGVYAIYYLGKFEPYARLSELNSENNCRIPIYVGKAVRKGARVGIEFNATTQAALFNRLKLHAKSIEGGGLELSDFRCKFLVIEDAFVSLAESVLIGVFRPLWNQVVTGFGNNPTGGPRSKQAQSMWDTLHPGRRRGSGDAKAEIEAICKLVEKHLNDNSLGSKDSELRRIAQRIEKYTSK